jgi:hypothetical protein
LRAISSNKFKTEIGKSVEGAEKKLRTSSAGINKAPANRLQILSSARISSTL